MKIFNIKSKFLKWLSLGLIGIMAILLSHFALMPAIANQDKFKPITIPLNSYDLYDIGITDINNDEKLDIFTTNHSALSSLVINQGDNIFIDRLTDYGMNQDRQFPGVEVLNNVNKIERLGLSIYRQNRFRWSDKESDNQLVISSKNIKNNSLVKGTISLFSTVKIRKNKNFEIELKENKISPNAVETIIEFATNRNGKLVLETDLTALPTKFVIDENVPLDSIQLGASKLQPQSHKFQLHWRDRHGTAWADFNGNGEIDAFITRGGLKGKLEEISALSSDNFLADELFSQTSDSPELQDIAGTSGLTKKDCPGRQTSWVDFNRDDKLDLYIVCGRGVPPLGNSPNQLYQQNNNLQFTDVAEDLGLAFPEQGTFAWLDTNNDKSVDFLWATKNSFQIFRNQNGKFQLDREIAHDIGRVKKLSIADFDADDDLDVFALGSGKSLLLKSENQDFTPVKPSNIGLPSKSLTANWVDYDNDGLIDFHAIPGGIFRQTQKHQFQATSLLQHHPRFSKIVDAKSAWFDANNDGLRDLLITINYRPWWLRFLGYLPQLDIPDLRESQAQLYLNETSQKNNWLQLKLVGRDNNPQAIGAKVEFPTNGGNQLIQVGHAEGSHFSQGHYRIYLGLGKLKAVNSIRVTWSDGQTEEFDNLELNHLNDIIQGSGLQPT